MIGRTLIWDIFFWLVEKRRYLRMAYATCGSDALRNAVLRVWTPAVGVRSWETLIDKNVEKLVNASSGKEFLILLTLRDHVPVTLPVSMEDYSDKKPPFQFKEEILSGSWSEGLYLNGHSNVSVPDMDCMFVFKHISFSENQMLGYLTLKEDTPFVNAYITDENTAKLWKDFLHDKDEAQRNRLSSKKLKERLCENNKRRLVSCGCVSGENNVDEGAAMYTCRGDYCLSNINRLLYDFQSKGSDDLLSAEFSFFKDCYNEFFTGCDIVLAISCDGWPSCAKEWITRDRIWPQCDLVQKITDDGFHIVPKSSTEGDFRLSFSYTETTLIESLTELQHKVLRSFKAVVKYHQKSWSVNIKKIMTTYHLKTIAFWHFEKRMQDSFTKESVGIHLVLLLQELAEAIRCRKLPMYFMPKVNLFKNIENPEEAIDIAEKIEKLSNNYGLIIKGLENITSALTFYSSFFEKLLRKILERSNKKNPSPDREVKEIKIFRCLEKFRSMLQFINPQN